MILPSSLAIWWRFAASLSGTSTSPLSVPPPPPPHSPPPLPPFIPSCLLNRLSAVIKTKWQDFLPLSPGQGGCWRHWCRIVAGVAGVAIVAGFDSVAGVANVAGVVIVAGVARVTGVAIVAGDAGSLVTMISMSSYVLLLPRVWHRFLSWFASLTSLVLLLSLLWLILLVLPIPLV